MTDNIKNINHNNESTWKNKIFITLDIDWASDDVLEFAINIIESLNIKATWFVTHKTKLLKRLRDNVNFELGIHPNFNNLLNGDFTKEKNSKDVMDKIMEIVPEAVSARSHSLTQNSRIQELFIDYGIKYECNHFIPAQSKISLKPWILWNGLIKIPHYWEDDLACLFNDETSINELLGHSSLKVFAFHPINIYI